MAVRARTWTWWLTAAATAAVVLTACGERPGADAGASSAAAPPGWERLADAPVEPRDRATITWTGDEVVVAGGRTFLCPPTADCGVPAPAAPGHALRSGAALDPATRTWRRIADAPLPIPPDSASAAVAGDVYVLVRSTGPTAAMVVLRYRPAADAWDTIEMPPGTSYGALLGTDAGLLVYPRTDEQGERPDLLLDVARGTWSTLPPDPLGRTYDRTIVDVDGTTYLFANAITASPNGASGPSLVMVAALSGGAWTTLPTGDVLGGYVVPIVDRDRIVIPAVGCVDGGQVNNFGRCIPFGGAFDTRTGTWGPLPPGAPADQVGPRSAGAWTADEVLVTAPGEPMLDLTTDTWSTLPPIDPADRPGTLRTVRGAGPYAVAVGGARFDEQQPGGTLLGEAYLWSPRARDPSSR